LRSRERIVDRKIEDVLPMRTIGVHQPKVNVTCRKGKIGYATAIKSGCAIGWGRCLRSRNCHCDNKKNRDTNGVKNFVLYSHYFFLLSPPLVPPLPNTISLNAPGSEQDGGTANVIADQPIVAADIP